jgi:DNA-binding FadR family transcriptional regulator
MTLAASVPETGPHTAIDTIFEKLLGDIVRGVHQAGARLPPERELARQLGASRPTLREALRRLGEWSLVEPRRGSGVVVRPYRDWSIEVIPAYLRYGKPQAGQPTLARMLVDLFALRRAVVLEVVQLTAGRIPPGATTGCREAMARAWAARDLPSYAREDFEVMRAIVEAAGFTPGLWLLNRFASIWFDMADALRVAARPPDDYVPSYTRFFDLLDRNEAAAAVAALTAYLERHDARLVEALGLLA